MSCCGNCVKCSGCAGSLELTQREMDFLRYLGQVAFLPVARSMGDIWRTGRKTRPITLCCCNVLKRRG